MEALRPSPINCQVANNSKAPFIDTLSIESTPTTTAACCSPFFSSSEPSTPPIRSKRRRQPASRFNSLYDPLGRRRFARLTTCLDICTLQSNTHPHESTDQAANVEQAAAAHGRGGPLREVCYLGCDGKGYVEVVVEETRGVEPRLVCLPAEAFIWLCEREYITSYAHDSWGWAERLALAPSQLLDLPRDAVVRLWALDRHQTYMKQELAVLQEREAGRGAKDGVPASPPLSLSSSSSRWPHPKEDQAPLPPLPRPLSVQPSPSSSPRLPPAAAAPPPPPSSSSSHQGLAPPLHLMKHCCGCEGEEGGMEKLVRGNEAVLEYERAAHQQALHKERARAVAHHAKLLRCNRELVKRLVAMEVGQGGGGVQVEEMKSEIGEQEDMAMVMERAKTLEDALEESRVAALAKEHKIKEVEGELEAMRSSREEELKAVEIALQIWKKAVERNGQLKGWEKKMVVERERWMECSSRLEMALEEARGIIVDKGCTVLSLQEDLRRKEEDMRMTDEWVRTLEATVEVARAEVAIQQEEAEMFRVRAQDLAMDLERTLMEDALRALSDRQRIRDLQRALEEAREEIKDKDMELEWFRERTEGFDRDLRQAQEGTEEGIRAMELALEEELQELHFMQKGYLQSMQAMNEQVAMVEEAFHKQQGQLLHYEEELRDAKSLLAKEEHLPVLPLEEMEQVGLDLDDVGEQDGRPVTTTTNTSTREVAVQVSPEDYPSKSKAISTTTTSSTTTTHVCPFGDDRGDALDCLFVSRSSSCSSISSIASASAYYGTLGLNPLRVAKNMLLLPTFPLDTSSSC